MKIIRLASFMLLLTLVMFLVNGFAEGLPKYAITQINTGQGPINAVTYSQSTNRLAIAAANNIHIYDADTHKELMVLAGHADSVQAVAFSLNGKLIVSGSADKTVRLWEAETGKLRRARDEHTAPVNIVAFLRTVKSFGVQVAETTCSGRGTRVMAAGGVPRPPHQIQQRRQWRFHSIVKLLQRQLSCP